ncbi:MAG: DUF5131 family protein [Candidatus Bathyarchaeia archaeon]
MVGEAFGQVTGTWNPITGCLHECTYCWARRYSRRLASMGVEPYKTHMFRPAFAEWRLKQRLRKGRFIFVSDMGDMWGEWVPKGWIEKVLKTLRSNSNCRFLFLTKNPARYHEFEGRFTQNMMLGATIETNRDYGLTRAPSPRERYKAMKNLERRHKAIVVEPILDFDREFTDWMREISPEVVYIGYDNYGNRLPEPKMEKTKRLIRELEEFADVRIKTLRRAWYET